MEINIAAFAVITAGRNPDAVPAKAGGPDKKVDSRLRGNDDNRRIL